jgi:large repetitive protein
MKNCYYTLPLLLILLTGSFAHSKNHSASIEVNSASSLYAPLPIVESCDLSGWEFLEGRIFWLPGYGIDFKASDSGMFLQHNDDGTAIMYGHIERISDSGQKFEVSIHWNNRSTYDEWIAQGGEAKNPEYGDETTWIFYDMDYDNTLIGVDIYDGIQLNLIPQNNNYGLQIGDEANALNSNANGFSCWFDYNETTSGNGDMNSSYECLECGFTCAGNIVVECLEGEYYPEITGYPVSNCLEEYTFAYSDEWITEGCEGMFLRHWVITNTLGQEELCDQEINVIDSSPPTISAVCLEVSGCEVDFEWSTMISDNCTNSSDIIVEVMDSVMVSGGDCAPGQLRTQTQGGWGTNPSGNNPGVYLEANFANAFPNGLTIGCENTLHLSSSQAVRDFLPSGSTPRALDAGNLVDPGSSYNNVLAGQLVAATLSTTFDAYDTNFGQSDMSLSDLTILEGTFASWTVGQLLEEANQIIGGCNSNYSYSQINQALSSLNENYVDGTTDNGFVGCDLPFDCALAIEYSITATDECGNSATWSETLYVVDTTAPVFVDAEEFITVECGQVPPPGIEVIDDCFSELVIVEMTEAEFSGACIPTIQRTYTATDDCGNQSVFVQYISVQDFSPPVYLNTPVDVTIQCGDDIPMFEPLVVDNCSENVDMSMDDVVETLECGQQITRTFTAIDACSNVAEVVQVITILDEEAPFPSVYPEDVIISCLYQIPNSDLDFQDLCSEIADVDFTETQTVVGCELNIQRNWVAVDVCGNETSLSQLIQLVDTQAPQFVFVPADVTLGCGDNLPDSQAEAFDSCSDVSLSYSEQTIEGGNACLVVVRTWIALDACGNTAVASQTVSFEDTIAPALQNVPADTFLSCDELTDPAIVWATDNCDDAVEVLFEEIVNSSDCAIQIIRTWTATDACGNIASAAQMIELTDQSAPQFIAADEVYLNCTEMQADQTVEVVDDCLFAVNIEYVDYDNGDTTDCTRSITRVWTATDACGNEATFQQQINVVDDTPPFFTSLPADLVLPCGSVALIEYPVTEDFCSDVTLSLVETESGDACYASLIREWIAVDECGNTVTHLQSIQFIDIEAPVLEGVPADLTLDCADTAPAPETVTSIDNCDAGITVVFEETTIPGSCSTSTIIRTWTATDNCGNSTSLSQEISFIDQTPPVFDTVLEDIVASCANMPELPSVNASDDCGTVTVVFDQESNTGGCPSFTRVWVATDACGNSSMLTQVVELTDSQPPVFAGIPANVTVDCNNIPEMPEPEASDNCDDNVAVTATQSVNGSGCEFTIIRTWIASDDCGNTAIASQSITVEDTSAPVIVNLPAEQTVECSMVNGLPYPEVVDDCGATVTITFEDVILGEECIYDIERTYTATDLCGHQATGTTLIHVEDNTPPMIVGVPMNTYVDCSNIPNPEEVEIIDGCSSAVDWSVEDTVVGEGCNYMISRTYTASDACGNTLDVTQLIYVQDNQAPSIEGVPANLELDCSEVIPTPSLPSALDNCSPDVQVNFIQFSEELVCGEQITRIWSATDDCGNQATASQVITVTDMTGPVFNTFPQDSNTTCFNLPAPATLSATDACSGVAQIIIEEQIISGSCPYEMQRTYRAFDDCGNSTMVVEHIYITDNEMPVLTNVPADVTVGCGQVPAMAEVTATDDCAPPALIFEESWGEPGCTQQLWRTWTAVDLCGNTTTQTQTISIEDNEAPNFNSLPEDLVVSCLTVPEMEVLQAIDDCGVAYQNSDEMITPTECESEYTIVRVWVVNDACGNAISHVQEIQVVDDVAPILVGVPEDIIVSCSDIPVVPEVYAIESCGEAADVIFTEETIDLSAESDSCNLGNASTLANDVALWLPGIEGISQNFVFGAEGGILEHNQATGMAHLTGQVYNEFNANQSWIIDLYLHEELNWDAWSALGRSYKDDANVAGDNYQDWSFFVVDHTQSRLVGAADFAGNTLSLTHAPADTTFGFQMGLGANNRNAAYGMSGWFMYDGDINGQLVSGMGDVMTENMCCPEQDIIRTWTAIDCAGNVASFSQTIHVSNTFDDAPSLLVYPDEEPGSLDVTGTTGEMFTVNFISDFTGRAELEILSVDGKSQGIARTWDVQKGSTYSFRIPKSNMPPGSYMFVVEGKKKLHVDVDVVIR